MGPGFPRSLGPPSGVDLMSTGVSISWRIPVSPEKGEGMRDANPAGVFFIEVIYGKTSNLIWVGCIKTPFSFFKTLKVEELGWWDVWWILMSLQTTYTTYTDGEKKICPHCDSESAWILEPIRNKYVSMNSQKKSVALKVPLIFRSFSTEPYNIYNMKGARRINEPTMDPSLSKRPLYFTSWTLSLRTQNSLSPRYLGFDTPPIFRGRDFFSRPQTKGLCNTKADPFFKKNIKSKKKASHQRLNVAFSCKKWLSKWIRVSSGRKLVWQLKKNVLSCLIHPTLQKQNKPETSPHFSGGIFKEMLWNYLACRIIPFIKW